MADTPKDDQVEDLIRYDILAQEALRAVVKKVLSEVAQIGTLPGEHHFYITFDTNAPGVKMSKRMKEKYPEEMTIVVQHQFWDLKTTDNGFSIGLSFNDIPETLGVPYDSIRGFFDPAVQFGLQFDAPEDESGQKPELKAVGKDNVSALPSPDEPDQSDKPTGGKKEASAANDKDKADDEDADEGSADVVSLDAFRKK